MIDKYVPVSMPLIGEKEYTLAPHLRFQTRKPFDHISNIINIMKVGGCLRGFVERDGIGLVEIMTKRKLAEEAADVKIGRGRVVSFSTLDFLIKRKFVYFPVFSCSIGDVVEARLVDDAVISTEFPFNWSVVYTPHSGKAALVVRNGKDQLEVCLMPPQAELEKWLPVARAMAAGCALIYA